MVVAQFDEAVYEVGFGIGVILPPLPAPFFHAGITWIWIENEPAVDEGDDRKEQTDQEEHPRSHLLKPERVMEHSLDRNVASSVGERSADLTIVRKQQVDPECNSGIEQDENGSDKLPSPRPMGHPAHAEDGENQRGHDIHEGKGECFRGTTEEALVVALGQKGSVEIRLDQQEENKECHPEKMGCSLLQPGNAFQAVVLAEAGKLRGCLVKVGSLGVKGIQTDRYFSLEVGQA